MPRMSASRLALPRALLMLQVQTPGTLNCLRCMFAIVLNCFSTKVGVSQPLAYIQRLAAGAA